MAKGRGKYSEQEKLEVPYTIVGSTSLPKPIHSITLKGSGLKALAAQVGDEDLVHIKQWADYTEEVDKVRYYQRFSVSRWQKDEASDTTAS